MYTVLLRNQSVTIEERNVGANDVLMVEFDGLVPGISYTIQIAAHTEAGMGLFSAPPITQLTISIPLPLSGVTEFVVDETRGGGVTATSIPVTLPAIANVDSVFRYGSHTRETMPCNLIRPPPSLRFFDFA